MNPFMNAKQFASWKAMSVYAFVWDTVEMHENLVAAGRRPEIINTDTYVKTCVTLPHAYKWIDNDTLRD